MDLKLKQRVEDAVNQIDVQKQILKVLMIGHFDDVIEIFEYDGWDELSDYSKYLIFGSLKPTPRKPPNQITVEDIIFGTPFDGEEDSESIYSNIEGIWYLCKLVKNLTFKKMFDEILIPEENLL